MIRKLSVFVLLGLVACAPRLDAPTKHSTFKILDSSTEVRFSRAWPSDQRLAVYALNHNAQTRHIAPGVPSYQLWANTQDEFQRVERLARQASPDALFKTYMSAASVQLAMQDNAYPHSPPESIFDVDELFARTPTKVWYKLDDPTTASKAQDWIVAEIIRRGWPLVHFDNIVPPWMWSGAQSWVGQTDHVRVLTRRLNDAGIRTEVNSAVVPGLVTEEQWSLLIESANGATFEMPWHPLVIARRSRIELQMTRYRAMLAQGKSLGWFINPDESKVTPTRPRLDVQDAEARFLAALAICVREPGDFLWIGARFWRTAQDEIWSRWVVAAGPALGPWVISASLDPPSIIYRRHTNGFVAASFVLREGWFFPQ